MKDYYSICEKKLNELHEEIVDSIINVLIEEKGYKVGDAPKHYDTFVIMSDRLIINGYHTDNITVDNLLKHLHDAYHVLPNI